MVFEIDEITLNSYLDRFQAPLEQYFFGEKQKQQLALERAKLESTVQYVEAIEKNPKLGENLEKDVIAGKVYSVGQANDVLARIDALEEANGPRVDLRKSFVSPTGQCVILSERACQKLGVLADGFLMGQDIDDLISVLNDEFVDSAQIDKVREAGQVYPAIIIQRGGYAALQALLEETAPVATPKAPGTVAPPIKMPVSDHGASLEALRDRLNQPLPTPPAPRPAAPKPVAPVPPNPEFNPNEIKREIGAKELPQHQVAPPPAPAPTPVMPPVSKPAMPVPPPMSAPKPVSIPPMPTRKPPPVPPAAMSLNKNITTGLASLNDIKVIDDLKRIEPAHLRLGYLPDQFKAIKTKIAYLANANRLLPIQVVDVFQQSPLFRLYLSMGNALIAATTPETKPDYKRIAADMHADGKEVLSLQEFEGMADLRKELEHM
jgi:hypothetical protein